MLCRVHERHQQRKRQPGFLVSGAQSGTEKLVPTVGSDLPAGNVCRGSKRFVSEEAFRTAGCLADDEILVRAEPLPGSHRRLQDSPNEDAPLAIPRK